MMNRAGSWGDFAGDDHKGLANVVQHTLLGQAMTFQMRLHESRVIT